MVQDDEDDEDDDLGRFDTRNMPKNQPGHSRTTATLSLRGKIIATSFFHTECKIRLQRMPWLHRSIRRSHQLDPVFRVDPGG
jgi:hypothetical protein